MNSFYKFLLGALESKVETLVGERAFKEIYKVREEAELKEMLRAKAQVAENRWCAEYPDRDLSAVVKGNSLVDLPSVQIGLRALVDSPHSRVFVETVQTQLQGMIPPRLHAAVEEAACAYATYVLDELLFIEGLRENLTALAQKATAQNTAEANRWLENILTTIKAAPPVTIRLPPPPILVVHAKGDDEHAKQIMQSLVTAGYDPQTAVLAETVLQAARPALEKGGLVVLCATQRAMGNKWTRQLLDAPRLSASARLLGIPLEEDVELDGADYVLIECWRDSAQKMMARVLEFVQRHYPLRPEAAEIQRGDDAEAHYRKSVLEDCDIVKINNLPQPDKDVATRQLQLRRLYMPLHAWVDVRIGEEPDEEQWQAIEKRRAASLRLELGQEESPRAEHQRAPIGDRLREARRLVILGDPGSGKTTLTRWLTTAYLLRGDQAWRELPDVKTLPDADLLPVIIRLRDFDGDLPDTLDGLLRHALRKSQLPENEVVALHPVVMARIQRGEALLMFDGLDEINDPKTRARFCAQLETIHNTYDRALIVATSRIVGYNEMGYRLGRGFEHLTLADLEKEEKDAFARHWCELTEIPSQRAEAAEKLIQDVHSSDRIERLTGNPMLLTTMALVKRKVGKLPSRRAELYFEAVQVLLNWRPEVDTPLDWRETVPQLEYVAYAMCDRGVQRLSRTDILELLNEMRTAYPNLYLVKEHTPEDFLKVVEARTGLLIEAGNEKRLGLLEPVYEFRHLTFQEYLAARALVDGVFPKRDPTRSLAEYVAPLAGRTQETVFSQRGQKEVAVVESWREALRLCISICSNDDVDPSLLAILTPLPDEPETNTRARAILAALCIADEPANVSEAIVQLVFQVFAEQTRQPDGHGPIAQSGADIVVRDMANTRWVSILSSVLLQEFLKRPAQIRESVGGLYATLQWKNFPTEKEQQVAVWETHYNYLKTGTLAQVTETALLIMVLAFQDAIKGSAPNDLVEKLFLHLFVSDPLANAVSWALFQLNNVSKLKSKAWHPLPQQVKTLLVFIRNHQADLRAISYIFSIIEREKINDAVEPIIRYWLSHSSANIRQSAAKVLGAIKDERAVDPLIAILNDRDAKARQAVANALGAIKDERAVNPLIAILNDPDVDVRQAATNALGAIKDERAVESLIAILNDPDVDVRRAAANALGTIKDERAIEPLIVQLKDSNIDVRQATANALGKIKSEHAVDLLLEELNNSDAEVRKLAAQVLGTIKDERAVEPLIVQLKDSDIDVRQATANALGKIKSEHAVDLLLEELNNSDAEVRKLAAQVLGDLESKGAVDLLIAILNDPDAKVRQTVTRALGNIKDEHALEHLIAVLDDPDANIRQEAADALGNIQSVQAITPLIVKLNDPDTNVRQAAAEALGRIGSEDAIAPILAQLNNSDIEVRQNALGILVLDDVDRQLVSQDLDGIEPFLDPHLPITTTFAEDAAQRLELPFDEIRTRYEKLSNRLNLKLEWTVSS